MREFGIRQTFGADPRAILALVLSQGLRTAGLGILIGIAGSFAATRSIQSMLYGVERTDVPVLSGVSALLFVVALSPATSRRAGPHAQTQWRLRDS